jgi:hypothetical protein
MVAGCHLQCNWLEQGRNQWTANVVVELVHKHDSPQGLHVVRLLGDSRNTYKMTIISAEKEVDGFWDSKYGRFPGIQSVVSTPIQLHPITTSKTTPLPAVGEEGVMVQGHMLVEGSKVRMRDPSVQTGSPLVGIYSLEVSEIRQGKIKAFYLNDDHLNQFDWFEFQHFVGMMKKNCENDVSMKPNPSYIAPPVVAVVVPPPTRSKSTRKKRLSKRLIES